MRTITAALFFTISILFSFNIQATNSHITLGIFPYASTSKLVSHHKNVKKHIEKTTEYNVSLVTAKSFPAYLKNTLANNYDIIYSPPHIARYLEKKHGYKRVAMTAHKIRGIFLVRKDSSYQSLSDLENKTISMAPEKTILHQIAVKELADAGLENNKNVKIKVVNTHNNAMFNVVNNDSDAAVTGIKLWNKLPAQNKEKLRALAKTTPTSGFILMAKPELSDKTVHTIQNSLLSFNDSIAGKNYLFKGFKKITDTEMQSLDFHARIFE